MFRFILSFRRFMLIASFGAAFGAVLMFWEGSLKLLTAATAMFEAHGTNSIIAPVMAATDTLFFAVVLVVFAYAITFGFAIELSPENAEKLPRWMRIAGLDELKQTLVGVVLVFLIVDFATDWWADESSQSWPILVKPASILMIAAALRLLTASRPQNDRS
jgi:uncharacterized membrane protein YqhA